MKKYIITFLFLFSIITINAQDYAMNISAKPKIIVDNELTTNEIIPLIKKSTYTYKYKGDNVQVVFSENEHVEYFNNKKYFIKSTLKWTANDECFMTLVDSNLPRFPFKKGIKLHMKINKIKKGYIYYQSTLGGRSWTGKMKKL